MGIWSSELKELEKLHIILKDQMPLLGKELSQLTKSDDPNVILLYSRRCLEVLINDLCECELKRPRKTEPLQGVIDKLSKEGPVPSHIVASMHSLNSLSNFGAHPKEFDPKQVKPVLNNLEIIISWYYDYKKVRAGDFPDPDRERKAGGATMLSSPYLTKRKKVYITISGIIIIIFVVSALLYLYKKIDSEKRLTSGSIQSLIVLPFVNYTGTEQMESLISGMHACLISDICRFSGLRVINSTTSQVYKKVTKSVNEIARDLNVEAVIEVSVLGIGDSIILKVSLIKAMPREETIWIRDFTEEKSQLLNLYNRITKQIAEEIKIKLTDKEEKMLNMARTVNPDALVAYMKGKFHWERLGNDDIDSALYYFNIANQIEPDWADPIAGMAISYFVIGNAAYGPLIESYEKANEYLLKALELDPNSANSHFVKACTLVWPGRNWESGEKEYLMALELDPSDALCRIYYAELLMYLRRTDEGIHQANISLALDPLRPIILAEYSRIMIYSGDYRSALVYSQKALSIDPNNNYALNCLADAYLETGDTLKWYAHEKLRYYWTTEEYLTYLDSVFTAGGYYAVIRDRIKVNEDVYKKGGAISYSGQALRYLEVKNYDRAMDYFEKAYDDRLGDLGFISLLVIKYPEIRDNPRYIALLKKINLPVR